MAFSQQDVEDLAYCAWQEARGEGISGCYLVMQVVYNRTFAKYFPHNIHDVIYQKDAFSWTLPTDPEYGKRPLDNDPIYVACLADAPNILCGTNDDLTKGALYYANESITGPGWYRTNIIENPEHPVTLVYGRHTFRT